MCGKKLKVYKTCQKKVATLDIGDFIAVETQLHCNDCSKIYNSEELSNNVAHHCRYGFDVIVFVGESLFVNHQSDFKIQQNLKGKNISISLREIAYLGKKFIVYLALAHQACKDVIKNHMQSKGGYILHIDGTCEGKSPHIVSSMDEISKIVLDNIKVPIESAGYIKEQLIGLSEAYGEPLATMHDMSPNIINAVKDVFPNVPMYVCHFHFLRDVGKDLLTVEYSRLVSELKRYRVRSTLYLLAREIKKLIESSQQLSQSLNNYLSNYQNNKVKLKVLPLVAAYLLITWVLESASVSNGYGFPFDRKHFDFFVRLKEAYPKLMAIKKKITVEEYKLSFGEIGTMLKMQHIKDLVNKMQDKFDAFDELRGAMRIALPDGKHGLNDDGDEDINTIKRQVELFRNAESIVELASKNIGYKKMVKQIDKYWDKLFADPIQVETPEGEIYIQPQRTNNLMESFFRDIKNGYRKKLGAKSLTKVLKNMLADTPLVKNLKNAEYVEIILDGKSNLAERFAEIDIKLVRETLRKQDNEAKKYPRGMAKIFKLPQLPQKLSKMVSRRFAVA